MTVDAAAGSGVVVGVELGPRRYDVVVGPGVRRELAEALARAVPSASRAVVVTQEGIPADVDTGLPTEVCIVPDGEMAKSLATVEVLCRSFVQMGLARSDVVVAAGGGVVTDLAGFAAASYHRGIAYVNVATSLLAQVDAAIGGKTGVNLPEGKNLVGAFWHPRLVLCDTELLASLPEREWASGRGEVAKYAFLADPDGRDPDGRDRAGRDRAGHGDGARGPTDGSLVDRDLTDQVATCVGIKARVVAADEREADGRMVLNYGHTLAHALEAVALEPGSGLDLRHGEAVAIGLVFAAELAAELGRIDAARVAFHREVVERFGLSWTLPPGIDPARLVAFMARDKKAAHDLTFVLDGPEGVEVVRGVRPERVLAALRSMEGE
ncbi:MAG: 3-dehydroquinate synthase [Acidimicrobiales bacterium]